MSCYRNHCKSVQTLFVANALHDTERMWPCGSRCQSHKNKLAYISWLKKRAAMLDHKRSTRARANLNVVGWRLFITKCRAGFAMIKVPAWSAVTQFVSSNTGRNTLQLTCNVDTLHRSTPTNSNETWDIRAERPSNSNDKWSSQDCSERVRIVNSLYTYYKHSIGRHNSRQNRWLQ